MLTRGFSWTDQNINTLRQMLGNGSPASEVAARIGCSRNAVIGKAARMGIALNGANARGAAVLSRAKKAAIIRSRRDVALPTEPQETDDFHADLEPAPEANQTIRKTLLNLNSRDCRWSIGHVDGEQTFCCEETVTGCSWCAEHRARVFVPRASGSMPIMDRRARA